MFATSLRCVFCGSEFPLEHLYFCSRCGGILDVQYNYKNLSCKLNQKKFFKQPVKELWQYKELLPVCDIDKIVSIGEGGTCVIKSERLAKELGLRNLYLKNETTNPTGSFKDRPITIGISKVKELGGEVVVIASSGNAGASLSAYAAKGALKCIVLVPENTPLAKVAQAQNYGANIVKIEGSYSDSYKLAIAVSREKGWWNMTTTFLNPYSIEGNKTVAYELIGQLNERVPDWIVVPIGAGPLLVGILKGFKELRKMNMIEKLPAMVGVQAAGCAPIVRAYERGDSEVYPWNKPVTIATAIADSLQGYPQDGTYTLRTIRESGGLAVKVTDRETIEAVLKMAQLEGIFAEATGAIGIAGIKQILEKGLIDVNDVIVCLVTGHGLKDPEVTLNGFPSLPVIKPEVKALEKVITLS